MPKWTLSVVASTLFVYWLLNVRGHGFTLTAWWHRIVHRPLGDWYLSDLLPFVGIYIGVRAVSLAVKFINETVIAEKPREKSEPQEK